MTHWTRIGGLFPRNHHIDSVETTMHFDASPAALWQRMMFYEEVPGRPSWLLRQLLPVPLATRGDKTRVGSVIECQYERGYLEKKITGIDERSRVTFDVVVQRLGIEDSVTMTGGSYRIRADDDGRGARVTLTTSYVGHARPRSIARPLERLIARRVHLHILDGMRIALAQATSAPERARSPSWDETEALGPVTSAPQTARRLIWAESETSSGRRAAGRPLN